MGNHSKTWEMLKNHCHYKVECIFATTVIILKKFESF